MKKILLACFLTLFSANLTFAQCNSDICASCSYRMQKKMLHNRKMVKNKVINAQVKGKMLAIQELSKQDCSNNIETRQKILAYQKQLEDLTNQKICLKREYKTSLHQLKANR